MDTITIALLFFLAVLVFIQPLSMPKLRFLPVTVPIKRVQRIR